MSRRRWVSRVQVHHVDVVARTRAVRRGVGDAAKTEADDQDDFTAFAATFTGLDQGRRQCP
jgi:hypothetical protein